MAIGQKTGGRKKGTPNKRTQNLLELINEQYGDFSPILELIKIYKNDDTSLEIKTSILKDISPYMYPKMKTVERDAILDNTYEQEILTEQVGKAVELVFKCIDILIAQGEVSNLYELRNSLKNIVEGNIYEESSNLL